MFTIEKQHLSEHGKTQLTADSREYVRCAFLFSEDWRETVKTAVFAGEDKVYSVLLENDTCTIPHEVLGAGFDISVYGIKGDMRITTDTVHMSVRRSGFFEGETPQSPSPNVYEQIISVLGENSATLKTIEETLSKNVLDVSAAAQNLDAEIQERKSVDSQLDAALAEKADLKTENGGFAGGDSASALGGSAVGDSAYAAEGGAVGQGAAAQNGFAGGMNAKCGSDESHYDVDCIQLGTGLNSAEKTLQVYDNQLLDANGIIPTERIGYAGTENAGVMKLYSKNGTNRSGLVVYSDGSVVVNTKNGLYRAGDGSLNVQSAEESDIDEGTSSYKPIVPKNLSYAVQSITGQLADLASDDKSNFTSAVNELIEKLNILEMNTDIYYKGEYTCSLSAGGDSNDWSIIFSSSDYSGRIKLLAASADKVYIDSEAAFDNGSAKFDLGTLAAQTELNLTWYLPEGADVGNPIAVSASAQDA